MASILSVYDEGSVVDTQLIGAKGFSVLVEADGERVLFDTGLRDRYLMHNMEHLEIDPESIDAVVISQACPDNCRAINGLLEARTSPVDVYAPAGLYSKKSGFMSFQVGLSDENRPKATLHDIDGWLEVVPGVWVSPQIDGESFLVVRGKQTAVVSGRGVNGPGPQLSAFRSKFGFDVKTYVGAVLLEKRKKTVAEQYALEFESYGCTDLHLNHCTGRDGMTNLRAHFGLKGVDDFYAGMMLEL